jgi:hypothetical protein
MNTLGLPNCEPMVYPIDYYKIGIAKNPDERLRQLSAGTPHVLELVTTLESNDAKELETKLHSFKDMKKKRGEWFYLGNDFVESLKELDFLSPKILDSVIDQQDHDGLKDRTFAKKVYSIRNLDSSIETFNGKRVRTEGGVQ